MELPIIFIAVNFLTATCQESNKNEFTSTPDFPQLVKSKYYVDKSLLIKTFLEDLANRNALVTAPRNFGKSVNLEMMKYFLEIQVDSDGKEIINKPGTSNYKLFTGLKIYEEREFFIKHFGKYPVIFVNYKPLSNASSYQEVLAGMRSVLLNAFGHHAYLTNVNNFWMDDLNVNIFKKYADAELNEKLRELDVKRGLKYLNKVMCRYFKRNPIVLIDGYDTYYNSILFRNSNDDGKIINLFQSVHQHMFKTSLTKIRKIFCTGILHLTGAGLLPFDRVQTDFHFLHNHQYSKHYGISDDELTKLVRARSKNETEIKILESNIKGFYGGYKISVQNINVYNTLSVVEYLKEFRFADRNGSTSCKSVLPILYRTDVKCKIIELLENKTAVLTSRLTFSKSDVTKFKLLTQNSLKDTVGNIQQLVLKFLLQHGYFTYAENVGHRDTSFLLRLPNPHKKKELESLLIDCIVLQYNFSVELIRSFNDAMSVISESDERFRKLFTSLDSLMRRSNFYGTSETDLQTTLGIVLSDKFQTNSVDQVRYRRIGITFRNDDVTFVMETKLVRRKNAVSKSLMGKCTEKAVNRIVVGDYVGKIVQSRHVVYLGVCVGVAEYKDGKTGRVVGLGYSTNFNAGNLNETNVLL